MYLPCVFLIISHSRFDRTIKNNYFSWLLPLNRGAAFCRISRILVKLHCWALLREFVTACWGKLTGRVKFTPQILLGVQMWPLFSILHTLSLDIHKLHIRLNEWLNLLGARVFWKKCWILTFWHHFQTANIPIQSQNLRITFVTSSRYDFLLVILRFSLTNLTIYSHAMNWTPST